MHIPGRLISDGSFSGLCGSGNTLFHALRPGAVSCHLTCPLQRVVVEAVMDEYCQVQEFGIREDEVITHNSSVPPRENRVAEAKHL